MWGWSGTVEEFLQTSIELWQGHMETHHRGLLGSQPSSSQVDAWRQSHQVLRASLRDLTIEDPSVQSWGIVFEYELPLEGGRRPDVVVMAGATIVVLEFKQNPILDRAGIDQVNAYARDLAEYHSESHDHPVIPVLVLPSAAEPATVDGTKMVNADSLAKVLRDLRSDGQLHVETWLHGSYQPLPFLIAAARRIFEHEPLPHIKRALATDIPQAVDLLGRLAEQASEKGERVLAFVAGVPGSGKTLAGLSLVYERTAKMSAATFLSGNGPLVEVLRDALNSKVFVKDLHAFIKTFGTSKKIPNEHVIVFDEAQRAWDADYMNFKNGIERSEPDLLVDVAERLPKWACLVGLVGDGQEINKGEESGIDQWHDAVRKNRGRSAWKVHCPPRLAAHFPTTETTPHAVLDLTTSLRSKRADYLHSWVAALLGGELSKAARLATGIHASTFPMYLTRDLEEAKTYLRHLYVGQPDKRYGLLASARSQGHLPKFGVDSSWPGTKRVKLARWYNEPFGHPQSCCALKDVVTEFGCQGLELDMPLICWSTDMMWKNSQWKIRQVKAKYPLKDNDAIRRNAYRVLLTRGRDGFIIFVPPDPALDETETCLLAAGVRPLELSSSIQVAI
jgi:hypothetical protein